MGLGRVVALSMALAACSETANTNPKAVLQVSENARVNVPVLFDASGSTDAETAVKQYRFDFGDGSEKLLGVARAEHVYSTPGTYEVNLTVYDQDNAKGATKARITVTGNRVPVAVITGPIVARVGQEVKFDGAGSRDDDGEIVSYRWDFGDKSDEGTNPAEQHAYTAPGVYDVTLTITDNDGGVTEMSRAIDVKSEADLATPPAAFLTVSSKARAGEVLTFDGTLSAAPGAKLKYRTYFGDGAHADGRSVNHAYAVAGNYTPLLMVTATYADGSTAVSIDAKQVSVEALNKAYPQPTVNLSAPASERYGRIVMFDASKSIAPGATSVAYAYTFGDGGTATGDIASHTYAAAGQYIVRLRLTATYADATTTAVVESRVITIEGNQRPVAVLTGAAAGLASQTLTFDGSASTDADGTIASYAINFGDGSPVATAALATHKYAAAGVYTVTLTVTDNDGDTNTVTRIVTVDSYRNTVERPVAKLAGPAGLVAAQPGTFTAAGSTAPDASSVAYKLYFGDGQTALVESAGHAFAAAGDYVVTVLLTATYPDGTTNTAVAQSPVVVKSGAASNPAPVASFTAPASARFGAVVSVDASASSAPGAASIAYAWNFGDASTGTGITAGHAYAAGTYTIQLTVTATYSDGSQATATAARVVTVNGNSLPVAKLSGDATGLAAQALTFDASGSTDADGTVASYAVDFGDGSPVATGAVVTHAFAAAGAYTVTLTVTDNDGGTATATRLVTISAMNDAAQAPVALLSGPANLVAGQSATFGAAGSAAPGATSVAYKIYFGDGQTANAQPAAHAYAAPGNYTASLLVTATYADGTTNTAVAYLPVAVTSGAAANDAPVATFTAPASARFSDVVNFDASASTAPGAASVAYSWNFGDATTGNGALANHTYAPGTYTIQLTVTATYSDGSQASATASRQVTVQGNAAPVAVLTGDIEGLATEILAFDATGSSDADGLVVATVIDFGDGTVTSAPAASHGYAAPGTYTVRATVTDNDGDTATTIRVVTIRAYNQTLPSPVAAVGGPTQLEEGQTGVFTTAGSSASGAASASYRVYFGDGQIASGQTLSHAYALAGNYQVTLLVTATYADGSTATATAVHPVQVLTAAQAGSVPTASFTAPATIRPNELLTLDGTATAPGTGTITSFQWDLGDGRPAFTGAASVNVSYPVRGLYTITLTVTNSDNLTNSIQRQISVLNNLPLIAPVNLSAGPYYETSTLTAQPTGSWDDDGDTVTFVYRWYVNGLLTSVTTNQINGNDFSRGDTVQAEVIPFDGYDQGRRAWSPVATILNAAPSIASVDLTDGPIYEAGTITATPVGWYDPDGDAPGYSYDWYVNGVYATSGATIDGADFDHFDVVYARVTPDDGTDTGTPVDSEPVVIANTSPVISSAAVSGALFYETSTLSLSIASSDADGDAVDYVYQWQRWSGTAWGDVAGAASPTLTGASFNKNDSVRAVVMPKDAWSVGATFTTLSVVISNSAPVVSSVTLNAGPHTETSTLTATAAATDADPSDNPINPANFAYEWFVNGSSVASGTGPAAASLTGAFFDRGDDVFVRVTYTDGTATSAAADSATVTIQNALPVVTSATLSAGPHFEASTISAVAAASDADGLDNPIAASQFTYAWSVNGSAVLTGAGPAFASIDGADFDKNDVVRVAVTYTDNAGGTSPALYSAATTVQNTAPAVASVSIASAGDPAYGTDATFYVAGYTGLADGDPADTATLGYQWYVNGLPVAGQTGTVLTGVYFDKGDSVYVQATPFDGDDYGTAVNSAAGTVVNTAPTFAAVDFGTGPFYQGSTLTAAVSGYDDADGDAQAGADYRWFVNGLAAGTTASINSGFAKGDTVTVSARVTDGTDASMWLLGDTVTIQNTIPTLSAASIAAAPSPATEASTLSISYTASDADAGDTLTLHVRWYVNGVIVGENATLTGAAFDKGDVITANVQVFDGTSYSNVVATASVTIQNAAPTALGFVLAPTPRTTAGLWVQTTAASTDPDPADSVTLAYAWYKNGALQGYPAATTFVPFAALEEGDTWKVVATPSDGFASGATSFVQTTLPAWVQVSATGAPSGRSAHSAVWTGSEMIVWGGDNAAGTARLSTGGRYNPATDTWLPTASTSLSARRDHKAVWTGSQMILWGGLNGSNLRVNDGARYDPTTDQWFSMAATAMLGRVAHAMVWTGSKVVVWGGVQSFSPFYLGDGGQYDPATNTWSSVGASPLSARYSMAYAWSGKELLIWGGFDAGRPTNGARYNPATDNWTMMAANGVMSGRELPLGVWTGSKFLVWGGGDGVILNASGAAYDLATDTWSAISATNAPAAAFLTSALWTGREMIVWGGAGNGNGYLNTGSRYDPQTNTWTAMGASSLSGRQNFSAVWTGREAIYFGGWTGSSATNDGARYEPPRKTEAWVATNTSDADLPTARTDQAAVWTGSEMIVWGGWNGGTDFNTGGRYNPATDTWLPTSTGANVPAATHLMAYAWIGGRMVVWGGTPSVQGGRYDPTTDSWATMSTTNQPSGAVRYYVAFAASEEQLFVWGGFDGAGYPNNGGLYDPATDTWTPTGAAGTAPPLGRHHPRAIWSGREFVVWGGHNLNVVQSPGYALDPSTLTWRAISSTGAPASQNLPVVIAAGGKMLVYGGDDAGVRSNDFTQYDPASDSWTTLASPPITARLASAAVWTGRELLLWGGTDGADKNDGYRYDPRTDTWAPMLGTGAPAARTNYYPNAAVWTGREMIVWGGWTSAAVALNAGARYTPPRP